MSNFSIKSYFWKSFET